MKLIIAALLLADATSMTQKFVEGMDTLGFDTGIAHVQGTDIILTQGDFADGVKQGDISEPMTVKGTPVQTAQRPGNSKLFAEGLDTLGFDTGIHHVKGTDIVLIENDGDFADGVKDGEISEPMTVKGTPVRTA